jgi:hypothetical protein
MAEVVEAWPTTVGAPIAANAWPARISRDGTLHVAASSSAWAFELTQCAGTILDRLRKRLGGSTPGGLRFAVGPLPEVGRESVKSSARAVPKVRPEHRAEGERIAHEIGDLELRSLVARAVAVSLAGRATERTDRRF